MQQKAGNTIGDQDVEMLVSYHVRSQKQAVEGNLRAVYYSIIKERPALRKGMGLFLEKCSTCHALERALSVIKDPNTCAQTITRMQFCSRGSITGEDAKELVNFHVSEQQKEIMTFQQTCMKCHDDARINNRSMTEKQWIPVVRRMQLKAPELITDEKVAFTGGNWLWPGFFYGKCGLCHSGKEANKDVASATTNQLNGLIALASEEFGDSLKVADVNNILSTHVARQHRNMMLFENNCTTCHSEEKPEKQKPGQPHKPSERTRAEWISYIAENQGMELSKDIQKSINSQIEYHISSY